LDAADIAAVRARAADHARRRNLDPVLVARAEDLAADLLAVFARHGISPRVVENVTSVTAASVDAVGFGRTLQRDT
jgi:hypothetical protein